MAAHRLRRYSLGGLVFMVCTAVAAAVLFLTTGPPTSRATAAEENAAAAQDWSDEFDGPAGSGPDRSKWTLETGGAGGGNNELQYYTDSTENAALDGDGNLVITARENTDPNLRCWYGTCEYTSARLNTAQTFTQAYGRYEARIRIPRGQGMWPAFWMLGDDFASDGWPHSGEIDIMENVGHEPDTVHGTIHGPGYSGGEGVTGSHRLPDGRAFADDFHVFAVDWAPGSITWSVDGQDYQTLVPEDVNGDEWVFDHPFFMLLNLAVGGSWPGSPDASTSFPQQMVVDYVRVTASEDSEGGNGGGDDGSGFSGVIRGQNGMCVDIANADSSDGTPVQLHNCSGVAAQRWTFHDDGTVRAFDKCLDVAGAGTADGTPVQIVTCNGNQAQQWVHSQADDLVNPVSDKCLEARAGATGSGTRLQISTCTGAPYQKWTLG
ncbi:ricin-type beta-trefoil lectin domain protein [Streptomyces sp. CRN 30]|uniref:ricin-type beta-trefoil lectin domain protein n=1 Tax=Streptomyces sp. CRN 30 TaxID=3075613 RepID=UPI002A81EC01|nr:family 16 glycosylhydrolase [Streptomyces sp. CRN 30]